MWDEEKKEYRGARESRFTLAGGTALGKRRPRWVMAAELVETDRLRARTVAQIAPDRIESVARHLVPRLHPEPLWEPEPGAAARKSVLVGKGLQRQVDLGGSRNYKK